MKRAVATGLVAAVVTTALVGCRPASRTPPPPCTLEVTDDGQGELALAFLLANPGRVHQVMAINLPFPRTATMRTDERYHRYLADVTRSLHSVEKTL